MQFLGVLVAGTVVLAVILFWRLTAGPISISYLTPFFEAALSPETERFSVRIEDTILDWSEEARTLNVKLLGARVLDPAGATLIRAPELQVSLSAAALLRGQFAPRSVSLSGTAIRITRNERGNFELGTQGDSLATGEGASDVVAHLLDSRETGNALSYLSRVNILNAQLTIDDRMLDLEWSIPAVNISLIRTVSGITGLTDFELKVGEQVASIQLNADYRSDSGELTVSVGFAQLRPKALANVAGTLALLAPFDMPLSGTLALNFADFREISRAEFNVTGGPGRVSISEPMPLDVVLAGGRLRGSYDAQSRRTKVDELRLSFGSNGSLTLPAPVAHTFAVRELAAEAVWSQEFNRLDIGAFRLALDQPVIEGAAQLQQAEDGAVNLEASARATGLSFEGLANYWPESLASDPRRWVLKHIPSGRAGDARVRTTARWSPDGGFQIQSLGGELATGDAVVDYLPPMPKVVKGAARARFDQKMFDIALLGGESAGLTVRGGRVIISDLDKKDQWTDIDMSIDGPLDAALAYIDSEPFRFARDVGMTPKGAEGTTSARLKLRFIAENKLTVDQIKINAEATIKEAVFPQVAFGLDLTQGNLKLAVDNTGLDVSGNAALNGIGSEVAWRHNFAKNAPFVSRYRLKVQADANDWRQKLGINSPLADESVSGPVGADVTATFRSEGRGSATADINFDRAALNLDAFGWSKPPGGRTRASLEATFQQGKVAALPKISAAGEGLALEGEAVFASDGRVASARVGKLVIGETDIAGAVFPRGGGWEVDIHGRQLDLKRWMEDKTPEDPNKPRGDALAISLNVGRVRLYEDRYINSVSGALNYDGLVVREAKLRSALDGGGTLTVELAPTGGRRSVAIASDNAGAVLRALDVNDNVTGGQLNIVGEYGDMRPASCLSGRVSISDFRVRNAPVLARLLNAASIVGLLESLGGEGIRFDSLHAPFTKKDGLTRFEGAKASGLSIGLTASGWVNSTTDIIDVEGNVIPANVLNSVLGRIPLVGRLFGGEGGIFAIEYKIAGDKNDPEVSTNPLTVLTPGFTRQIFSIFERKEDEPIQVGCPKAG